MSDRYDIEWMADHASNIILAAVDGDGERCAALIVEVGERYGSQGGYGLCCALAEAVEDAAQDMMAAVRFVTAYLNRDSDQTLALFHAPRTPEEAMLLPVGLVKLVGASGRHKLEQSRGSDA